MPRFVDPGQRKQEIITAAYRALAEGGFSQFSFRALARRLGGSITLITHYFPTRDALLAAMFEQELAERETIFNDLGSIDDPRERLRAVLNYFLPADDESLLLERARVALVSQKNTDTAVADFFDRLEPAMRDVLRTALAGFVDSSELEGMVDVLRAWTSGVVLSAVEHPEIWTAERQRATLERFMSMLSLPAAT